MKEFLHTAGLGGTIPLEGAAPPSKKIVIIVVEFVWCYFHVQPKYSVEVVLCCRWGCDNETKSISHCADDKTLLEASIPIQPALL